MEKLKSRWEDLQSRTPSKGTTWNTKNKQPIISKKTIEGRTVNYMTITEIDQAEEMAKINCDMFRIENINDVEAINQLTENNITPTTFLMIENNEKGAGIELDKMEAQEWADKYVKQYKNQEK